MSHALSYSVRSALEEDLFLHFGSRPLDLASTLLLSDIFKKLVSDVHPDADAVAFSKFTAANMRCKEYKLSSSSLFDDYLIGEVRHILSDLVVPDHIFSSVGFGPGSCHGSKNENLAAKLDGPWTTTSRWVYGCFIQAFRGSPHVMAIANARSGARFSTIRGSKICFVPKKDSESRLICCEPLLNMALQKSVEAYLTYWLQTRLSINLENAQFVNRRLARMGSVDGTYCTIDLSSASDSVSIELVRQILPPETFELLMAIRSPEVLHPDGTWHTAWMISSMGNATTFPLETIIFSAICKAVYRLSGLSGGFSVFGDDIVVHKQVGHLVLRGLALFGFQPNMSKTFLEGYFRESCGGDYYLGRNVRPVSITSLDTLSERYSAINRLVLWSARQGILLRSTVSLLLSNCSSLLPIPWDEDVSSGLLSEHSRGYGAYKALCVSQHMLPPRYSSDALSLAGLHGSLRGDMVLSRTFGRKRFSYKPRYSPNWRYILRGNPLFEDVDPKTLSLFLDIYGLKAGC